MTAKFTRSPQFPKLETSQLTNQDNNISCSTNVGGHGVKRSKKRSGRGVFRWPSGARYVGDFVDNRRHGEGRQEWPDGSFYVGKFKDDLREGHGRHTWCNGEIYEGYFVTDKRHGKGIYYWPDGTSYDGFFFNDIKEGFGIFTFYDGKLFKGLYKSDERNGPGILSYPGGRHDVGIWLGEKLIKLCAVMESAFVFQHFSDYYVNAGDNLPLKVRRANSALADARSVMRVAEQGHSQPRQNILQGRCEVSVTMQIPSSFPYDDICDGMRNSVHGPKGPCELASEELLRAAGQGDCVKVSELLEAGLVHVDVADKTGFTSLLAAAVNCHKAVINCLLNYGADVNKLNFEGLSPLAACHVLFYTKHTWKGNIAETMTKENLFNSVQWDIISGTFVQRGNQTSMANNKSFKVAGYWSGSSHGEHRTMAKEGHLNKISDDRHVDKKYLSLELESRNGAGFSVDQKTMESVSEYKEPSRNSENFENARSRQFDDVDTEDRKSTVDIQNIENDTGGENNRNLNTLLVVSEQSDKSIYKRNLINSLTQQANLVDKNVFIHEFLSRAASGLSNGNSSISHENAETSVESCYSDGGNVNCDTDESEARVELMVTSKQVEDPAQYSVQNTVGSSVQTSTKANDADSNNSVRQGKQKLLTQQRRPHLEATVRLLLRRGANPNASSLPMPVLFFAVKAADTAAVQILLEKGARTDAKLSAEQLGITPLHIAVALPSDAVSITELLLKAGADPNMRDFAFGKEEPGRTPLHTACCREDNDEEASCVISLLLLYKADPDMLCQGHSALSLAIASGNDMGVEALLKNHANPNLSLTNGVGSALCSAVSFSAEKRRKVVDRIRLVNKLIRNGANILAPIVVSSEHPPGTVVDYAYFAFYQDHRIAHTPYHALTSSEREVYIARRKMLDHLAELLRTHVLKKEKKLLEEQSARLKVLQDASSAKSGEENFDKTVSFFLDGSDHDLKNKDLNASCGKVSLTAESVSSFLSNDTRLPDCGLRVAVVQTPTDHMNVSRLSMNSSKKRQLIRKNRFRYCYECGRSVSVRLSACTRCKEVFYCSRSCKLKAWNSRHREECIRLSGASKSAVSRRTDTPTAVTNPDKDNTSFRHHNHRNAKEQNCRNKSGISKELSIK